MKRAFFLRNTTPSPWWGGLRLWALTVLIVTLGSCAHQPEAPSETGGSSSATADAALLTDESVPAKVATTVFFKTPSLPADDVRFQKTRQDLFGNKRQVALSVLVAEIARAEGVNVRLSLDIPDRVVNLEGINPSTNALTILKTIGKEEDFFVTLREKNLNIYRTQTFTLRVPPVGIVNDKKVTVDNYTFWKTLFEKQKVTVTDIKPSGMLTFQATPRGMNRITSLMQNYQKNGEIIDVQIAYVSLSRPMESIIPSVADLPATEFETGRSVRILTTKGNPESLMKALGTSVIEKDKYHALLFLGDSSTTHIICDRGLQMSVKRQGKMLFYNLSFVETATEGCTSVGPALQTESPLGDTLALSLSTNNAFILYPERITFGKTGGKDGQ